MSIYDRAIAVVTRQLADKGQLGAVRRTVTTGGGPTDPTGGSSVTTDYPARMALFPVDQSDVDGTFIKAGDWRVIVGTSGLNIPAIPAKPDTDRPLTTDKLVTTEGVLTIVDAGKFAPAGTITHYKMVARK